MFTEQFLCIRTYARHIDAFSWELCEVVTMTFHSPRGSKRLSHFPKLFRWLSHKPHDHHHHVPIHHSSKSVCSLHCSGRLLTYWKHKEFFPCVASSRERRHQKLHSLVSLSVYRDKVILFMQLKPGMRSHNIPGPGPHGRLIVEVSRNAFSHRVTGPFITCGGNTWPDSTFWSTLATRWHRSSNVTSLWPISPAMFSFRL